MPSIRRHHHMTSGFTKNMGGKRGRETPTLFVYKQRIIHETKAKKTCERPNLLFQSYSALVCLQCIIFTIQTYLNEIFFIIKVIKMKQFFYYWGTIGCQKNFVNICILLCYESVKCRCDDMTIADTNVGLIQIWGILQWSSLQITG